MKQKRAPIEQLREMEKVGREILVKRGVIAKESIIDKIIADPKAPMLPGLVPYLPHDQTIKLSQRIMYDLLREWQFENKLEREQENVAEFFKFVINRLTSIEKKYKKEINQKNQAVKKGYKKVRTLSSMFNSIERSEATRGMNKFFVDSFAISVIVKSNDTTSQYAEWFLNWTDDLYTLWKTQDIIVKHD